MYQLQGESAFQAVAGGSVRCAGAVGCLERNATAAAAQQQQCLRCDPQAAEATADGTCELKACDAVQVRHTSDLAPWHGVYERQFCRQLAGRPVFQSLRPRLAASSLFLFYSAPQAGWLVGAGLGEVTGFLFLAANVLRPDSATSWQVGTPDSLFRADPGSSSTCLDPALDALTTVRRGQRLVPQPGGSLPGTAFARVEHGLTRLACAQLCLADVACAAFSTQAEPTSSAACSAPAHQLGTCELHHSLVGLQLAAQPEFDVYLLADSALSCHTFSLTLTAGASTVWSRVFARSPLDQLIYVSSPAPGAAANDLWWLYGNEHGLAVGTSLWHPTTVRYQSNVSASGAGIFAARLAASTWADAADAAGARLRAQVDCGNRHCACSATGCVHRLAVPLPNGSSAELFHCLVVGSVRECPAAAVVEGQLDGQPFRRCEPKPLRVTAAQPWAVTVAISEPVVIPVPFDGGEGVVTAHILDHPSVPGLAARDVTLAGTLSTPGTFNVTVQLSDGTGRTGVVAVLALTVTPRPDCENPAFGPRGRACAAGSVCQDGVAFDGAFTCNCTGLSAQDASLSDNCDVVAGSATGGGGSASATLIGVLVAVTAAVGLLALLLVWMRMRRRSKDLERELSTQQMAVAEMRKLIDFQFASRFAEAVKDMSQADAHFASLELPRSSLLLERVIGEGHFGQVWAGRVLGGSSEWGGAAVAIKSIKAEHGDAEQQQFLLEARLMAALHHPQLLRVAGVVTESRPFLLVTPLLQHGDLRGFLHGVTAQPPSPARHFLSQQLLLAICRDVAAAMAYLAARKILHRDLAARNVLVGAASAQLVEVVLADFGLARQLNADDDAYAYIKKSNAAVPVKWMAPEAVLQQKYTVASDVWSFGVLCWEVFSLGRSPYPHMSASEVMGFVTRRGQRLACPALASQELYTSVMLPAWELSPAARPTFDDLGAALTSLHAGASADPAVLEDALAQYLVTNPAFAWSSGSSSSGRSASALASLAAVSLDGQGYVDEDEEQELRQLAAVQLPGAVPGEPTGESRL